MTFGSKAEYDSVYLMACENADIAMARDMLRRGATADSKNAMNESALHLAVRSGNTEILKFLLSEMHLNPNARDNFGRTPLHWACQQGSIPMCEVLLLAKSDINAKDESGLPPLSHAEREGHWELVKMLNIVIEAHR